MKNSVALVGTTLALLLPLAIVGCSKEAPAGAATSAAAAAASPPPECPAVVEKIASLNPPEMRGPAEKKLWGSMCAGMTGEQKTCVMGAKAMPDMQACMANVKLK
jgi:hypothetical protein